MLRSFGFGTPRARVRLVAVVTGEPGPDVAGRLSRDPAPGPQSMLSRTLNPYFEGLKQPGPFIVVSVHAMSNMK